MTWGYVVRISVYVEGDHPDPESLIRAAEEAANIIEVSGSVIDNAGCSIAPIADRPYESGGT